MRGTIILVACLFATSSPQGGASDEAYAHYRRGLELVRRDNFEGALREFRRAIDQDPRLVEAHREWQNIMLAFGFQEDLLRRYGASLAKNPQSAFFRYLYGRILDDPRMQRAAFRKAASLDRGFFWPYYGAAVAVLRLGLEGEAERQLRRALAIRPESPEARRLEGIIESRAGHHEEALAIYERLIGEDGDFREAYVAALRECRLLGQVGKGNALSTAAAALFPMDSLIMASRGYFLAREGESAAAIDSYEKAISIEPIPFFYLCDLRRLYAASGRYDEAVSLWKESFGFLMERDGNRLRQLWRGLEQAARDLREEPSPRSREEMMKACMGVGWWTEAASMCGEARGELAELGARAAAGESLQRTLRDFGVSFAQECERKRGSVNFRRAVARLAALVNESYGSPVLSPGDIRSRPGIRWLVPVGDRPRGLFEILRSDLKELVFLENVFARKITFNFSEVIYCSLLESGRGDTHLWAAAGPRYDEAGASDESGLAYPPFTGFMVYSAPETWNELIRRRRLEKKNPLEGGWFLEEVEGRPVGRREILYSRMLERRLLERACREIRKESEAELASSLESRFVRIVSEHELQHLMDLKRHLPVWRHPLRCLAVSCASLFRPSLIEAFFEERAMARGVSIGRCPFLALLSVHSQLAGSGGPHQVAARRLLAGIVNHVADHPASYPQIDTGRNIMNQLYLLGSDEIRQAARSILGGGSREGFAPSSGCVGAGELPPMAVSLSPRSPR